MGPWKYAIGAVMSFILLFSIVQNSSFSVIPDTKPQEPDSKVKFDLGFYEKVLDMINAGETREHTVIVYVKKAPMNGEDAKLVAKKNKDKLEDAMIKIHRAKNVYKAQILSFVVASVPIQEILKLAEYDFVLRIGDGELKGGPEMDVSRPTVNASTVTVNGTGVRVAVIDTGIRQTPQHSDLPIGNGTNDKIILQTVCSDTGCGAGSFDDSINHGTHVAGIIAGLGTVDSTFRGIANGAKLLNARFDFTSASMARALDWALVNGAKVVNASFFIPNTNDPNDLGLCSEGPSTSNIMIDEAVDEGVLVVKSAGNRGNHTDGIVKLGTITNPGCGFNVIAVGAIDDMNTFPNTTDDNIPDFSSRGPIDGRLKPELVAPGTRINSTDYCVNYSDFDRRDLTGICTQNTNFGFITGTSFAAPHVSGAAALLLQAQPQYSPLEVKAALLVGAKWNPKNATGIPTTASDYEYRGSNDVTLNSWGFGLLDVNKTLTLANTGKNIIKENITQFQVKRYGFSANQGEQVKIILSWLTHPTGTIPAPAPVPTSNLDLIVKRPDGLIVASSTSLMQNNEFAVFNATMPGSYAIEVSAPSVHSLVGTETFALASTHQIEPTFLVKKGSFTKATIGSTQFARPDSDIATGGWTVTPLWQKIDETPPDDTDFVTSPTGTSPSFEVGLSNVADPNASTGHVLKFRGKATIGSGGAEKAGAELYQGTTLIASTGLVIMSRTSFTQVNYALTSTEANSITDYNNLSVKVITSKGSTEQIAVSWIEVEVPAAQASQSITVGFKPKALLLFTTGQTAEGFDDNYNFAIGFSDGIDSRSIAVVSDDDVARSSAARVPGTKILRILNPDTQAVDAEADISFNTNGFTITWVKNDNKASIIHYTALGGSELTNAKVGTFVTPIIPGNQAVTGVGFRPDFVMFMDPWVLQTTENTLAPNAYVSLGFAKSSTERGALAVNSVSGEPTMNTQRYQRTDRSILLLHSGIEADFGSMDADGFTVNWITNIQPDLKIYYLALKGGQYDVGNFDKISSGATQSITNVGFKPKGLILASVNDIASFSTQPHNRLSFGASDGTVEGAIWAGDTSNVPNSITARSTTTQKVIRLATEAAAGSSSTINAEADLQSFDPDGFSLNWSINDSVARQLLYVAFGESIIGKIVNLSSNFGASDFPQIAVSGTNIHIVWEDGTPGNDDIFFRTSNNKGATFAGTINLSSNAGFSVSPQIAASGSNVYVVWTDGTPGNAEVFFRRSTDNGVTFSAAINLSSNSGNSDFQQIVVSGSNVYVAWLDQTPGNWETFFTRSTDNGATFSAAINLSNNAANSENPPQIAVSGSNVYVIWQESTGPENAEVFFRRSIDNGATFDPVINLSNNTGSSINVRIAASGSSVYVVWRDNTVDAMINPEGDNEVFFRRSTDNGATFGSVINLSNNTSDSVSPKIAVSGSNVYAVWEDNALGPYQAFYKRSTDNGATFGSTINLSNTVKTLSSVQLVASGSNLYVVWVNFITLPNDDVFLRTSNDNGLNFGPSVNEYPVNLSSNDGKSANPQVATSGGNVFVVWEDRAVGNIEIFFRAE